MRASFQVLVLPYRRKDNGTLEFAVFRRSDGGYWQGIAGGGEDDEAPIDAARREAFEEGGISPNSHYLALDTTSSIPARGFPDCQRWDQDRYVIPEYTFGVDVSDQELILSSEHTKAQWLPFSAAQSALRYDSNRTALGELHQKLRGVNLRDASSFGKANRAMSVLTLRTIREQEQGELRAAADRYWEELMPHALVIRDATRRTAYFEDRFRSHDPTSLLWWAIVDDAKVGFAKVDLWENHDGPGATVRDFYIERPWRHQGYGSAFAHQIVQELRKQGNHRIDLAVRRDNPIALAFWRSVGFDISLYLLRLYLDS